ncbi:MAG: MIP family channel protein [Albidovulum sp.]|uniref:MIP family channel protein n=1 Tax=Albidovulum sp. TaxID=1872424 RepID=UPI003C7FD594
MGKKFFAEAVGTFILVFFGVGSAVLMGDEIGMHGIALAFGLSIVAAAYGLGPISGAHLNPAVSFGMVAAGRMSGRDATIYSIAQVLGAVNGAAVVLLIAAGQNDYAIATNGLGQNGYGAGYLGEYSMGAAFLFETIATFVFVTVILGATQSGAPSAMAGLAIGLTLTGIHLVGINVTGVSVNPARSFGPAIFVGGEALRDLWLFILAPLLGGVAAGLLHAFGATRTAVG